MFLRIYLYFCIIFICAQIISCCTRSPTVPHSRRTRGDNGYKLLIGNSPSGYEPGKTYTLLLLGSRTHGKLQQFTHFTLTAQALNGSSRRPKNANPKRVGRFQLYSDSLAQFNELCINTVVQADDLLKTEVQVMWVAPEAGSGCVSLSAMVYEDPKSWYADEGELSKVICEKKLNAETVKKDCCACNEAKYKFMFEGIWSNETHPKNYPFAIWLTHFSDIVGATHDSNFSYWGENHIATDGFRSLAEWGSPTALEQELRTKGPRLRSLIKAPGLWYPNVNSNTSATFRVDRKHHKVSMTSMFGPSPDWVVGINGLDLCTEDCSWKESLDIDLYPWDAGTDSGINYMSPNIETQPREKMYRITTMYPEDPRAPFYDPNKKEMTPLAKLYIRREKIITRNCDDDFLQALQLEVSDQSEDEDTRMECAVTDYSNWSPCSVTCGKGLRMRQRAYDNPEKAEMSQCSRQLVSKEMCVASIPECKGSNDEEDEGENLALSQSLVNEAGEGTGICATTSWSDWNECSASCGIGITMRTRTFVNHLGRKRCPHISIVEKEKCMKPDCTVDALEAPDSDCPTTYWSAWSPCSASCGKGVSIRTRLLLVEPEMKEKCMPRKILNEQRECSVKEECVVDMEEAKSVCREQSEEGPCRGSYERFAFDIRTGKCESFIYGGCRGNKNNFLSEEDCLNTCRKAITESPQINTYQSQDQQEQEQRRLQQQQQQQDHRLQQQTQQPEQRYPQQSTQYDRSPPTPPANYNSNNYRAIDERNFDNLPQDCIMSEWGQWTSCNMTCGEGFQESTRYISREGRNGGIPCQRRIKRRRCVGRNC